MELSRDVVLLTPNIFEYKLRQLDDKIEKNRAMNFEIIARLRNIAEQSLDYEMYV